MSEKNITIKLDKLKEIINSEFLNKNELNILMEQINELNQNNIQNKTCPLCGNEFLLYLPFNGRKNAKCPKCGSLERHRFVYIYLQEFKKLFDKKIQFLHFAPEKALFYKFDLQENMEYITADLEMKRFIREKIDMCSINYDDNTFDIIMANHVLEHIPDDKKAMSELFRVIKPYDKGGEVFLMVPLFKSLNETFENEEYNTPELRLKYFGQKDHVRKYGTDFIDRLKSVGFKVTEITPESIFTNDEIIKYGIMKNDSIFECKK